MMKISEEQEKPKARYVVLCRYRSLVSVASMQYWDIIVGGSLLLEVFITGNTNGLASRLSK